jgi:NAD kinase
VADLGRKAVIVTRKTRLEELVVRYNTLEQARFYVQSLGADFADYELEHRNYVNARSAVEEALSAHCRIQMLDRTFLPNYLFAPDDLVIGLGQDGVVANILKYLSGQPLVGVNPDPLRFDGVLLPFEAAELPRVISEILADRRPCREVSMAEARLADGQRLLAVNDLFIGPKSHTSARYEIALADRAERHSSSGIIVSTGLGSTAWYRSIVAGAMEVARGQGANVPAQEYQPVPWEAPYLQFAVREPFPSVVTQIELVCGRIDPTTPLVIRSLMPENGVIFSDGIEADYLEFNSGMQAVVTLSERRGVLVQ